LSSTAELVAVDEKVSAERRILRIIAPNELGYKQLADSTYDLLTVGGSATSISIQFAFLQRPLVYLQLNP
jgi:hypothetical protein